MRSRVLGAAPARVAPVGSSQHLVPAAARSRSTLRRTQSTRQQLQAMAARHIHSKESDGKPQAGVLSESEVKLALSYLAGQCAWAAKQRCRVGRTTPQLVGAARGAGAPARSTASRTSLCFLQGPTRAA